MSRRELGGPILRALIARVTVEPPPTPDLPAFVHSVPEYLDGELVRLADRTVAVFRLFCKNAEVPLIRCAWEVLRFPNGEYAFLVLRYSDAEKLFSDPVAN